MPMCNIRTSAHVLYTWANLRIMCMGLPMYIMHGQTHAYPMLLLPMYNMRGQTHDLYAWVCPRIIYVGKYTYFIRWQSHV